MVPSSSPVVSGRKAHGAAAPDADAASGFGVALGDAVRDSRATERDARSTMRDERARDTQEEPAASGSASTNATLASSSLLGVFGVPQVTGSRVATAPSVSGGVAAGAELLAGRPRGAGLAPDRVDALALAGSPVPFLDGEGRVDAALVGRDDVRISVRAFDGDAPLASGVLGEVSGRGAVGMVDVSSVVPTMVQASLATEGAATTGGALVAAALQGLERSAQGRAQGGRTEGAFTAGSVEDEGGDVGVLAGEVVAAPVEAGASGSDVATSDESSAFGHEGDADVALPEAAHEDVMVAAAPGRGHVSVTSEAPSNVVVPDPSARQERVDRALDAVTLPSRLELDVSDRDGVWSLEIGRHHAGLEVLLRGDREFVGAVRGVEQDLRESLRATGEVARVAVSVDTSAGRGGDTARDQGRGDAWGQSEASSSPRQGRTAPSREASASAVTDAVRGGVTVSRLA